MKIYALGTSITAGSGGYDKYIDLVSKELGAELVNLGIAGGALGYSEHLPLSNAILDAADNVESDADIIIIESIMNDFRLNVEIGDYESVDSKTFCGALNLLLQKVTSKAPSAKIFLLTSHENADTNTQSGIATNNCIESNYKLLKYVYALEEVASRYDNTRMVFTHTGTGISAKRENGLNPIHTYDKLHLTNEGARAYADVICSDIKLYYESLPLPMMRRVAYVPLDNRPCNFERVKLAARSMGMELIMPEKNLTATYLDDQENYAYGGSNLQVGNTERILDWLTHRVDTDVHDIDAYLLSTDMLVSGGLVGSRIGKVDNDKYDSIIEVIRYLHDFGKPIYIIDTVMRLAATAGFNGYGVDVYNKTRQYGSQKRAVADAYSVSAVISNYTKSAEDTTLSNCGLTDEQINEYLAAREAKMMFTSKLIQRTKTLKNIFIFYGVDDSSGNDNIQTNEIKYIKDTLPAERGMILAGTDELATTALARIAIDQFARYTYTKTAPKVKITYFGGGEDLQADEYDYNTLKHSVNMHLKATNCNVVDSDQDLEVLILTRGATQSDIENLHQTMVSSFTANKLTAVIDASLNEGELQKLILNTKDNHITKLMAYSSWNTVGNSVGLCLGHAIGRTCFMALGDRADYTTRALEAQAELLFTEFAKDVCYQLYALPKARIQIGNSLGLDHTVPSDKNKIEDICGNLVKYSKVYNRSLEKDFCKYVEWIFQADAEEKPSYNLIDLKDRFYNRAIYSYYLTSSSFGYKTLDAPTVPSNSGKKHITLPWGRAFEAIIDCKINFK